MSIQGYFRRAKQWLSQSSEQALDRAYVAAQRLRSIEDRYFNGQRIAAENADYGQSSQTYFDSKLKEYLSEIKWQLALFHKRGSTVRDPDYRRAEVQVSEQPSDWYTVDVVDQPAAVLKKLQYIDETLSRYRTPRNSALVQQSVSSNKAASRKASNDGLLGSASTQTTTKARSKTPAGSPKAYVPKPEMVQPREEEVPSNVDALSDQASFLPRSILRTVDRIKQELDPDAEEEVVQSFRVSRAKTLSALKFILLLIIVPLLVQQVSKNILVGPIVDRGYVAAIQRDQADNFLNMEMEEEALHELQRYSERLRFEEFIGKVEPMSEGEIEERIREKAIELEAEYLALSTNAIKNVFADIFASVAFAAVLLNSRREIAILKSFIDEIVYGLSDSAKAFIIILFTDTFVGYHSPHGWEVLLEGISRHFGLPANRDFIFLFIATFPVILDTVFKYWIFRYLNRISPSAVATYRTMNE
ncbi:MAG: proton extrusion protein PcxA [Thainema sp.]